MDPNATLNALLALCEQWEEWGDLDLDPTTAMDKATELFLALNDWLSNGGFQPDSWR